MNAWGTGSAPAADPQPGRAHGDHNPAPEQNAVGYTSLASISGAVENPPPVVVAGPSGEDPWPLRDLQGLLKILMSPHQTAISLRADNQWSLPLELTPRLVTHSVLLLRLVLWRASLIMLTM